VTDYWSRPDDSNEPVFEITLTGSDGPAGQRDFGGERGDPRRQPRSSHKVAWLTAIIGIALVAAVAVVALAIAGDDSADTERADPTAAPLDTLTPVATAAPRTTVTPSTIAMPALSLPEYPIVPGTSGADLSVYDLEAAAAANVPGDVPRRTMFRIVGSAPDGTGPVSANARIQETLRATAANVPDSGRDRLTLEWGDLVSEMVVDRADEAVYGLFSTGDGTWRSIESDSLTGGSGTDRLDVLFDSFVAGPITPTTLRHSTVTAADELVRIVGGVQARRFDVEVPVDQLQPYGALAFANISTGTVANASAPDTITFEVYVTSRPALALVTAEFEVAGESFVMSQVFDRRPANVRIELPRIDPLAGP
jgi:hypothetical protein